MPNDLHGSVLADMDFDWAEKWVNTSSFSEAMPIAWIEDEHSLCCRVFYDSRVVEDSRCWCFMGEYRSKREERNLRRDLTSADQFSLLSLMEIMLRRVCSDESNWSRFYTQLIVEVGNLLTLAGNRSSKTFYSSKQQMENFSWLNHSCFWHQDGFQKLELEAIPSWNT